MKGTRWLAQLPLPTRHLVAGAVVLGAIGGVAGLIIGLIVDPRTAWFAVFELGLPASLAGGLLGLVAGIVTKAVAVRDSRATLPRYE